MNSPIPSGNGQDFWNGGFGWFIWGSPVCCWIFIITWLMALCDQYMWRSYCHQFLAIMYKTSVYCLNYIQMPFCISISSSAETVSTDYLQVYYFCPVWSVLHQELLGGLWSCQVIHPGCKSALWSVQVVSVSWSRHSRSCLQEFPGLRVPPGELMKQLM